MPAVALRIALLAMSASILLAGSASDARAQAAAPVLEIAVFPGITQPSLAPLSPGYAHWMRHRLGETGLGVAPRSATRVSAKELARRPDEGTTGRRIEHALRAGAAKALLVDLHGSARGLEIGLRLYDTTTGQLLAGRLTNSTSVTLAQDGNRALQALLPLLGVPISSLGEPAPLLLDEIAGLGRALQAFDRGHLATAWREIAPSSVAGAAELRDDLIAAAANPDTPLSERARLVAARGDARAAWSLIANVALEEFARSAPDSKLLQAAGEVEIARGRLSEAEKYFRRSLDVNARDVEATLGLAEALAGQNQPDQARSLRERASSLDPVSPTAVSLLANSETNLTRKAKLLLLTGEREAQALNPGRAHLYYNRAVKADPSIQADVSDRVGQLYENIGEARAAQESYQSAVQQGGPTGPRLHRLGRAQEAIGEVDAAVTSYLRSLELAPKNPKVMTDLAVLHTEFGRAKLAVRALEEVRSLTPGDPVVKRSLARALTLRNQTGDHERASKLFLSADQQSPPEARDLRAVATLQREAGDLAGARASLESAVALRPLSSGAQRELATVIQRSGDATGAEAASERLRIIANASSRTLSASADNPDLEATRSQRFDALVQTFASPEPRRQPETVVLLGLLATPPVSWEDRARAWLRPRKLDISSLERELVESISKDHQLVAGSMLDSQRPAAVSHLFRFGADDSLDPDIIASINASLGTDAVFVAVATPRSGKLATAAGCESKDSIEIELRKLAGAKSYLVTALSNSACLPASLVATGDWRWQSGALGLLLVLLIAAPFVRGWGGVVVDFNLPPHTKALFAVSLKRRPAKVKDRSAHKSGPASSAFQKRLQSLSRYERRLDGDRITFRWIPARRRHYYLTVRGPLIDFTNEQIIGDFMEEKTVRIRRGKALKVDFDMCPTAAAIEVQVTSGGTALPQSQVCLRGVPGSLRYAPEGSAFLYAGKGEHILVAANGGKLAEQSVRVETLDPMRVAFNLESRDTLVFDDCPLAVEAYMAGDFQSAADALASAGQETASQRVRALWHRAQGDRSAEARALAASGQILESAEILATETNPAEAAALFEEAGEHKRAAETYQRAGDLVAAARCFESAYDYENAIDCYRDLGDNEKLIELLEASGDSFEAAKAAADAGQLDRAIHNYQDVDSRHPHYIEVCRDLGGLLASRRHNDLAIEKFNEALELGGDDALPLETLAAFGQLLEDSGRGAEALEIYERLRRKDLHFSNVNSKIEGLREDVTRLADANTGATAVTTANAPAGDARYEILDELGRGGMGVVYKARDKHLGRLVAMKFLPENLQQHPAAVKLFLREARATAALNHPNIVTMYDAAQQDDRYFISMECLEGVGLDAVLKKRGPIPAKLLAQLGLQVCAGLDYAHRKRIVHRDIKPSNLFVTKERVLKIMDFGLAKAIEEVRRNSTVIGGTPNFMAPEQAAGEPVDGRTDLYSLGATLFQLLTGSVPFEDGDAAYHHRHTAPPDARERLASVPAEFALLLLELMAKAPDERVQTAAEVGARLKPILEAS